MDGEEGAGRILKNRKRKEIDFFFQKKGRKFHLSHQNLDEAAFFNKQSSIKSFLYFFVVLIERLLQPSILPCIKFFKKEKEKFAIVFR